MAHIVLDEASVELAIYNSRGRALKNEILRRTVGGGLEDRRDRSVQVVKALNQISFEARDGDRIGLIGGNGAGKTTLLRVLSRVYPPTSGSANIQGRVSSLIDLSMGMDGDATGYENIVMRGIMLGLDARQAKAITDDVEEFSQLGEFLSLPIRTYSSGMMLRLAFAVSTAVSPDIVILDEIIGVGDAAFAERAERRLHAMVSSANIMFLASHSNDAIMRFCNRTLWLKAGQLMMDGAPADVLAAYAADEHVQANVLPEMAITSDQPPQAERNGVDIPADKAIAEAAPPDAGQADDGLEAGMASGSATPDQRASTA